MQYTYEYAGETYTVQIERQANGTLKATIGEDEYIVSASQVVDGGWLMQINGERFRAHTAHDKALRYVHLDGTQYQLEKVEGRRKRKGSAGSGDLTAEMPGQVIDVRVAVGEAVQSGDVLVILEAMKMEIRITAPYDGTVENVLVNMGDVVERGQDLIILQPT